ncbi:peptidoglycan editing factor PgeF [Marinobacter sp. CA1]|uniref:peptidoglycan editing factor PgeF n=1 Tax=Marinobacter sp. CA1 TaxID=2817656 RepID=UPI001D06A48C|nr:peptidoglycan editing factor PgeF [Marinobacter sp. CA1]UDL04364.1 peptidoglycan editing factor PgeF [Marinobacter sp. CA1]
MPCNLPLIRPDWPAPPHVHAGCTTRQGGVSETPWASLNLGDHVADKAADVAINRTRLATELGLPETAFGWLRQVHGTQVVRLPVPAGVSADASVTAEPGLVCSILTADCLPVLLCDRAGTCVAAAHAGWRGLCAGVIEQTVAAMGCPPAELMAWLGPAIGPDAFEVGPEVRAAFLQSDAGADSAFVPSPTHPERFLANIYLLARLRLASIGVTAVYGGDLCTVSDAARFFSYRRDGETGRQASFIWLE